MDWTVISATNNERVLQSCLLQSPGIRSASQVLLQRNYASAAAAYNSGIEKADTDVIVLVHQDVYLPEGWDLALERALQTLSQQDPAWAVLGVWGIQDSGREIGHLFCTEYMQELGRPFEGVGEIRSLDEVVLIVRKSSGVHLDPALPGFHMYGTDLCLTARSVGLKCYAIPAFCVHNTNGYNLLPLDFWKGYLFLRWKWRTQLPIITSCTRITFWCWPIIRWNLARSAEILFRHYQPRQRVPDPARLYHQLVEGRLAARPA